MHPYPTSSRAIVPPTLIHPCVYPQSSFEAPFGSPSPYQSSSPSSQSPTTPDHGFLSCPPAIVLPTASLLPPVERWPKSPRKHGDYAARSHSDVTSTHPYARIYAKKRAEAGKQRKVWSHAYENAVFTQHELATMNTPTRRSIYQTSLEAYIDRIHEKMLAKRLFPVPLDDLKPLDGLNNKTAKGLIAGLQSDAALARMKQAELERTNLALRNIMRS